MDILMVRRDGRLSGEAYIVLSMPMHVELALSKNRTYLGRRYIEVYRAKKTVRGTSGTVAVWCRLPPHACMHSLRVI